MNDEQKIQQTIQTEFVTSTVITIAHRFVTCLVLCVRPSRPMAAAKVLVYMCVSTGLIL